MIPHGLHRVDDFSSFLVVLREHLLDLVCVHGQTVHVVLEIDECVRVIRPETPLTLLQMNLAIVYLLT